MDALFYSKDRNAFGVGRDYACVPYHLWGPVARGHTRDDQKAILICDVRVIGDLSDQGPDLTKIVFWAISLSVLSISKHEEYGEEMTHRRHEPMRCEQVRFVSSLYSQKIVSENSLALLQDLQSEW